MEGIRTTSIASINSKTKQFAVSPSFYVLDRRIQDFIMFQLEFLTKSCSYNDADSKALAKVMEMHPDTKKSWWIKGLLNVFLSERPTDFNVQRIRNLIQ